VDIAIAVLAPLSIVAATSRIEPSSGDRTLDALAYGSMIVAGAALGLRRRPVAVVVLVTGALCVYLARGYPGGPVFVTLFVALYWLATSHGRRLAFAGAAASAGALVVIGQVAHTGPGLAHLVFVGWAAAAVFLGDAVRSRRAYLVGLEQHALYLEQSRDEEARRRVAEERLRIAQDLHDSVAHSMATINVHAGVAEHVIDRHPDRARDALGAIRQASGEVLDELAALLGVLRVAQPEDAAREPTPHAPDVTALVDSARRAGLHVELHVDGDLDDISPAIGTAAYRIVQESLTNVVRHAGVDATAVVTMAHHSDGTTDVEVADSGVSDTRPITAPDLRSAGVGLVGMRERATSTGGTLSAAPVPRGGFVVRATWPDHR
jgi:signal transduction histidine kinase